VFLGAMKLLKINEEERRRDQRFELALPGRYMLRDGHEYPCWTLDISPAGVAIIGLSKGSVGERVVAYIDQIGRIEGMVARHFDACFAVKMEAPALKRERIARKIAWLVERQTTGAADNRQHERVSPRRSRTILSTPDGNRHIAALIDISIPGAALSVAAALPVGSQVIIGQTAARVVRQFEGGIAVAFDNQLSAEILTEDVIL